ncbi:MAG: geranylgeranyl diphosphate synthase, type [Moorella sp. (in: firmicutes)]|uniref:Farnesyl diphosphate synthase n=1 Tax=Moorella mulderi DSM 14980 TaxID=1122241 RepID=A0A151AVS1_9FIRM|nr:farnesyl diphosphate synthase [Moorella mulderi]KYH31650.1 farnesyl diphosphate synthase [Moorella mulderi DSM 14980]MDK2817192.1 geranylgeranyl diphosphate synthase, type [Moorella sp. (in: firmicutes)]
MRVTELESYLASRRQLVQEALEKSLPPAESYPPAIHQAMRYSLFAGGKRLRPILVLAAGESAGSPPEPLLPAACAVELIHTYSLIHDDLPAMDNDDYRRGRPTCHKVFGEAIALLAGDALLTQAFAVLSQVPAGIPPAKVLQAIGELATAAGSQGMIGGQVVDMEAEGQPATLEIVNYIHTHKTGSLIRACLRLGGILSGAGEEQLAVLTRYGENLGLAFQITDDILDIEGDFTRMGKKGGMDVARGKATYPACLGLKKAREIARELCAEAQSLALSLGPAAEPLFLLAGYVLNRQG